MTKKTKEKLMNDEKTQITLGPTNPRVDTGDGAPFALDVKRCYIPGTKIIATCPKCGFEAWRPCVVGLGSSSSTSVRR